MERCRLVYAVDQDFQEAFAMTSILLYTLMFGKAE
jgi:hypothetical protein